MGVARDRRAGTTRTELNGLALAKLKL